MNTEILSLLQDERPPGTEAAERGDDDMNDLIVSEVVRPNERQSGFVSEQLHGHHVPPQPREAIVASEPFWPEGEQC